MARSTYKLSATRTFGIEIEAFGATQDAVCAALNAAGISCHIESYNHTTRGYWKLVSDGSIQGPDSFELVSPPLAGAAGIAQVETVCRVLASLNVKVNKSCGLHVHHDANDLTLDQWKNLCKYYLKYEATLDTLVPQSRRLGQNAYCAALRSRFTDMKDAFMVIDRATTLMDLEYVLQNGNRYYTLNLTAFWRHGTVEVRHHSGTIEAEKILHWVSLTQCLLTRAIEHSKVHLGNTDLESVLAARCYKTQSKPSASTIRYYHSRQAALAVA